MIFLLSIAIPKLVGIAAGLLTAASMLPQVIKMFKEKKGSQVSLFMILILMAGIALWIWYGILKDDYPIIFTNCFSLMVNCMIVFLKYKYRNKTSSQ